MGDIIYHVDNFGRKGYGIRTEVVKAIRITDDNIAVDVEDGFFWKERFNDGHCFTDKAQAETRLKELKGESV